MWQPFGSAPANGTASWRGSPDERGTLNILSICIITLLLCAYTSLHLNIPQHGKTGWRHQIWRRTLWVVVGLGAPELVSTTNKSGLAVQSSDPHLGWLRCVPRVLCARRLESDMQAILQHLLPDSKLAGSPKDVEMGSSFPEETLSRALIPLGAAMPLSRDSLEQPSSSDKKRSWTRVHSHFTLMGGYVFGTKNSMPDTVFKGNKRLTLTPAGIRKIASNAPELLPNIEKSDIEDKSKANGFAKFLVCAQACWFIVQTVGRLATGLPISLLEMNTLLHALCCLLIYLAWWHKPLDITEPHLLDISQSYIRKVCAWMMVKDTQHVLAYTKSADGKSSQLEPFDRWELCLRYENDMQDEESYIHKHLVRAKENNRQEGRPERATTVDDRGWLIVYQGQSVHGFVLVDTRGTINRLGGFHGRKIYAKLGASEVECLRLAQSLRMEDDPGSVWKFGDAMDWLWEGKMLGYGSPITKSPDDEGMQRRDYRYMSPDKMLWAGLLLASSIYGGVHLLAWTGPFPNKTQRLLWQISCFIIAGPIGIAPLFCALIFSLYRGLWALSLSCDFLVKHFSACKGWRDAFDAFLENNLEDSFILESMYPDIDHLAVKVLAYACGSIYAAARTYLIVECFINVAHLPDDVFREPTWSQYLPHFGAG